MGDGNSYMLSQNGFVFVTYPVLILLFSTIGAATMLTARHGLPTRGHFAARVAS
jgi:hypothetical protein